MKKKYIMIAGTCFFLAVSGICYSCTFKAKDKSGPVVSVLEQKSDENEKDSADSNGNKKEQEHLSVTPSAGGNGSDIIYVHLCGAVAKPDVYEVKNGARLVDVIELAGGLNGSAAGDYINQAMLLEDGQRIYIPTKDEIKQLNAGDYIEGDQAGSAKQKESSEKININEADEEELMSLPGIGQAKADSIIKYRSENGKFKSIEELMNIPGIKEGLFNKISSYITI